MSEFLREQAFDRRGNERYEACDDESIAVAKYFILNYLKSEISLRFLIKYSISETIVRAVAI